MRSNNKTGSSPLIPDFFLRRMFPDEGYFTTLSDIAEDYQNLRDEKSPLYATLWYWMQLFTAIPYFMKNKLLWSITMFRNYLKVALRNIKKQKVYSFINISGLALGMACFILIMLYVRYELSFDKFHTDSERIYRVALNLPAWSWRGSTKFAITNAPLAPALMEEYPEVEFATRMKTEQTPVSYKLNSFLEQGLMADKYFLDVFSFQLLAGDQNTSLAEPYTIILSRRFARKLFGQEDPVGKAISLNDKTDCTVTGVFADVPENSHLQFEYVISLATLAEKRNDMERWGSINYASYIKLEKNTGYKEFEKKLVSLVEKHHTYKSAEKKQSYFLQPLERIHLHSHLNFEISENSHIKYMYILSSIALLILLIACINFVNCATARSVKRYKEIGVRKTIGANRIQLIRQFLGESFIITTFSMIFAVILTLTMLPAFSEFVKRQLDLNLLLSPGNIAGLAAVFIMTGLVSGIYPAFLLSSFKPVNALKNRLTVKSPKSPFKLKNFLVLTQFIITIILIIFASVIQKQMYFVKFSDAGFQKDNILVLQFWDRTLRPQIDFIKRDLLRDPRILSATLSDCTPVQIGNVSGAMIETENAGEMARLPQVNCVKVDYDYIDLYGLELVAGRNFSADFPTDAEKGIIVNETAIRLAGIKEPIGKRFTRSDWNKVDGRIIGVVKDFHYMSFKDKIEPVMLRLMPNEGSKFALQIKSENIQNTLSFIRATFQKYRPGFVFDYYFLDDAFNSQYLAEQRLGTILIALSIVAISIASLGLIGLVSFIVEQTTKEVGIRKTLGAPVSSIITLLSRDLLLLVLMANMAAWPLAYYLTGNWLQEFNYRIEPGLSYNIFAGFLTLLFAILTVSWQSIRAARANPVDALKYE